MVVLVSPLWPGAVSQTLGIVGKMSINYLTENHLIELF